MPKSKRDPVEELASRELRKKDGEALGERLRSARRIAGETLESVARKLTESGIPVGKAAVGHWETGHAVPDALQIRRLAKIYGTTVDALLWDDSLTIEAVRFAAQFDALNDAQQRAFRGMWMGYFEAAAPDTDVAKALANANEKIRGHVVDETSSAAKKAPAKRVAK